MQRDGNRNRCVWKRLLHNTVASALADGSEPVLLGNLQISAPEKTRSLPNGCLNLCHKNLVVVAAMDFRVGGVFEEQRKRLDKVGAGVFD